MRADRELVRLFYRGVLIKIDPRQAPGGRVTDADGPAGGENRLRHAGSRSSAPPSRSRRSRDRRLRGRLVGHAVAVDQDAPGLRPPRPGQAMGVRPGGGGLRPGARGRDGQRPADRPHDRTSHREPTGAGPSQPSGPAGRLVSLATPATSPPRNPATARPIPNNRRSRWKEAWHDRPRPGRHQRAEDAAAGGQTRPLPRHPARTARPGQAAQPDPPRVPRTGPRRRSHPPRDQLRQSPGPSRRPRPRHDA